MKQQYVGDVNDFRKYSLLRHFADGGQIKIGICWMLTPDDQGPDGRKLGYLGNPKAWRDHDPELFDSIVRIVGNSDQRLLGQIECSGIISGAVYFDETVPDQLDSRNGFIDRALEALRDADLIFFDPDNGIEIVSKPKGRRNSAKFLYWDEIAEAFRHGHSLLIYQHFTRENRDTFVARLKKQLQGATGAQAVWAFHTAHVLFLLATSNFKIITLAECLPDRLGMKVESA